MNQLIKLLILLIPIFPLVAFLINGLAGRWLRRETGGWIAVFAMGMSALLSSILLVWAWAFGGSEDPNFPIQMEAPWHWIDLAFLQITFGFHFDELTAVMCFVVTFVGSLVFLYSIGYMHGDPGFTRFFAYLSLFAFSMLILVLADSFLLLFIGWEGVGLCSYLLIGYYMDLPGAPSAGKKAFIVNRIGDFGFLLAMFLIVKHFGTLNIQSVLELAPQQFVSGSLVLTGITLLLLLGCIGKSAQIPLFIWLPDAMAGPTPVSALIHAATMVTAGVYLVARTSVLFALAPVSMETMVIIGAATAFVAATIALTQRDIKKVLAYSTVSQLGYMFMACGVGAFSAGIFHLLTHAFFKACLFLGAGAVIHSTRGTQDLFLLGGLRRKLRLTWLTFFAACLAISGFPLTAGFFSKDEILWKMFSASSFDLSLFGIPLLYAIAIVTAAMTAVYSFRVLFLAFHGETRLPSQARSHLHPPPWTMSMALLILAAGSLGIGFLNVPAALGGGARFEHFLEGTLEGSTLVLASAAPEGAVESSHGLEIGLTVFSSILALVGIGVAYQFFLRRWPDAPGNLASRHPVLRQLSASGWWWDLFCNVFFAGGMNLLARLALWFDQMIVDGLLHGIANTAREACRVVRRLQMGQVQAYALVMLAGANLLLLIVLLL